MNRRIIRSSISIERQIEIFNNRVKSSPAFSSRSKVKSTRILFYDDEVLESYPYTLPSDEWAIISAGLAQEIIKFHNTGSIILFSQQYNDRNYSNSEFINSAISEIPILLKKIASVYLEKYEYYANTYDILQSDNILRNLVTIKRELENNSDSIIQKKRLLFLTSTTESNCQNQRKQYRMGPRKRQKIVRTYQLLY